MKPPGTNLSGSGLRHVFVRDMVVFASVGIYPHEHQDRQRVRINVDLAVIDDTALAGQMVGADELARVVNYEKIVTSVRAIAGSGHIRLVETMAERIAEACLTDARVRIARIRVEKLDIFADAASAGVEVERQRPDA
ncbi:dihydroneopterin aldolase [Rhodopila sp.]|uniref:dihydroneopterin aldolase n=1 Tax=Rhodopila sp. TaxID=2480087 RepID=UPI003D122D5A